MAEGKIDIEQRKHPRAAVKLDVSYEWLRAGSKEVSEAMDISVGGLRICSDSQPRRDDRLRVTIALPDGKEIDVDGTVMWVARAEELNIDTEHACVFGLKFSDFSEETCMGY